MARSSGPAVPRAELMRADGLLRRWLVAEAFPRWAAQGYDHVHGGFHELLQADGPVADAPRRARVQLRQIYSFARAKSFGWGGDAASLVSNGLDYFMAHYRRPDGLFRTLVAPDGTALDERALLYDQAFVLLALAESQKVLGTRPQLTAAARELRERIYQYFKGPGPGYRSGVPDALPLRSNPHMHLLEAALSWIGIGDEPQWRELADEIVSLALGRFIDARTGALLEQFDEHWTPWRGAGGRIVEPGHQFEWAWLLLRWRDSTDGATWEAAMRLIGIGEQRGVRRGTVINALSDDLAVHDGQSRLWPQTERLKAAIRMAELTGAPQYWTMAAQAAATLQRFLDTPVPGLWYDRMTTDGQLVQEPSPASSFYHIIGAVGELAAVGASRRVGQSGQR